MSLHGKLTASCVLLSTLLFTPHLPAQNPAADLVLIHGHILTVDANDSVAQALAVSRGVIVKVGTDAEVLEFAGNAPGNPASSTCTVIPPPPALSTPTPTSAMEASKNSTG